MRREAKARGVENRRELDRKDAASTVYWLVALSFLFCILIVVPLCGTSWAVRSWTGFGVRVLWIQVGLLYMNVEVDCSGHKIIADRLCQVAAKVTGEYPVHTGVNIACSVSNRACEVMNMLFLSSFLVFGSLFLSIVFELLGAALLYNYWYSEPLPRVRRLATLMLFASPMIGLFGLLLWALVSPDIDTLPQSWTSASAVISGTTFFGYSPMFHPYYGWCFWWSVSTYMAQGGVAVSSFLFWSLKHPLEEEARENERREKEMLETEAHTFDASGAPYGFPGKPAAGLTSAVPLSYGAVAPPRPGAWG